MFPTWILGCLISLGGSVAAIAGTTIQKLSFRKNDALPLSSRRVYWRQRWWLAGLFLVFLGGVTDFAALSMTPQSTIAALGSPPLAANVFLAYYWLGEAVTGRDFAGTFLIVLGSTLSVVFGDHDEKSYTSQELQQLYGQPAYIAYGGALLVSIVVMYCLCRWKLTPLRVRLIEAIDAHAVAVLEEKVERAEEAAQARAQQFRLQLQQEYEESVAAANAHLVHQSTEGVAHTEPVLFSPLSLSGSPPGDADAGADAEVDATQKLEALKKRAEAISPSAESPEVNSAEDAEVLAAAAERNNAAIAAAEAAVAAAAAAAAVTPPQRIPRSLPAGRSPLLLGDASSVWGSCPQNLDAPLLSNEFGPHDGYRRSDADADVAEGRSSSPAASEVRVILGSGEGEGEGEADADGVAREGRGDNGGALSSSSSYSAYEAADAFGRAARCASRPPSDDVQRLRVEVDRLERVYKPWSKLHPVFFCALSGIFGAQSLLFGKSVASLLATSVSAAGPNQFLHPLTYAFMAALGLCLIGQLHFFATGLHFFQALLVVPVFKCFFLTLSTLGGALYFQEVNTFRPLQWALFPLGLVLNLCGVYVLSSRDMRVEGSSKKKSTTTNLLGRGATTATGAGATRTDGADGDAEVEEVRSVLAREESARFGAGAAAAAFEEFGASLSPGGHGHPHHLPRAHSQAHALGRGYGHHYAHLAAAGDDARSQASYAYSLAPSRALSPGFGPSRALSPGFAPSAHGAAQPHAQYLSEASESLLRSAVAVANDELLHPHSHRTFSSASAAAHPSPATWDQHRSQSHAQMQVQGQAPPPVVLPAARSHSHGTPAAHPHPHEHERVMVVSSPMEGVLLVASELPEGALAHAHGALSPALHGARSPALHGFSSSRVPTRVTSPALMSRHLPASGSWVSPEPLATHMYAQQLQQQLQRSSSRQSLLGGGSGDHAASLYPALAQSPSSASLAASSSFFAPAAMASVLADGSSAMGVAVFASPSPTHGSTSASGAGLAQVGLARTSSEQPPRHPPVGMGRGSRVQSVTNLTSLGGVAGSDSFGLLPPRASAPGTPRSSAPGTPRSGRRQAPDLLVQRGAHLYRAPAHSEATPLDSSMGTLGLAGAGPCSDSGSASSASALDALPLYLTPADSSAFTVTSPTTNENYSMPRDQSIFPHTRGFMARLAGAAAGIMHMQQQQQQQQRAVSPGAHYAHVAPVVGQGSLQYADGYAERLRSNATSPSHGYTTPTPRQQAAYGLSAGASPSGGVLARTAHVHSQPEGHGALHLDGAPSQPQAQSSPSILTLLEEEAALREARDPLAFAHILAPTPAADAQHQSQPTSDALSGSTSLPQTDLAPPPQPQFQPQA